MVSVVRIVLWFVWSLVLFPHVTSAETLRNVSIILELKEELERNETDLCIVRMPVRTELYEEVTDAHDEPLKERHEVTLVADVAQDQLEKAGIPVINLYSSILRENLKEDLYGEDRFHFKPEANKRIADIILNRLEERGIFTKAGASLNVVFLGECFAESFAEKISVTTHDHEIKVLCNNGGGHLVHNYLFVFREEYLEDVDLVVWIFTDRHFANPKFMPLDPNPEFASTTESIQKIGRMKMTTQLELGDEVRFEYPDALRASLFEIEGTGESIIGIDQILRDRQVTLGRKVREGDRVRMNLVPWRQWIKERPEMARLYMIDDTGDFELPRYWIQDWLVENE